MCARTTVQIAKCLQIIKTAATKNQIDFANMNNNSNICFEMPEMNKRERERKGTKRAHNTQQTNERTNKRASQCRGRTFIIC